MRLLGDWRYEGQDEESAPWMTRAEVDEWLSRKPKDLREWYRFIGPAPDTRYGEMAPVKYGPENGGWWDFALPQGIRTGLIGSLDLLAATKTGELTPEALGAVTAGPAGAGAVFAPRGAKAMGASRLPRDVSLPSLRDRPADEAMRIARKEPHLIKSDQDSLGLYVGGPPSVKSYQDLQALRRRLDERIEAGAGAGWFRSTRDNINEVTGGDPISNDWMSHQHGMWGGGVRPENELAFALRENNGSIAGVPRKGFMEWQHDAHLKAVESKDPGSYRLGNKTGEYQKHIKPPSPGANSHDTGTGVNDFRIATEFQYANPRQLDTHQHAFMDHEIALATDRARQRSLLGRSNWTGEEVQEALWLNQRKESILKRQPALLRDRLAAAERLVAEEGLSDAEKRILIKQAIAEADAEAFSIAKKTIGDFFDKHTAHDIYPLLPSESVPGHMPGLASAEEKLKAAYAKDPRSTWASAPGGRDAIYGGTGIPGTGVSMRVRPTTKIPGESTEVARPLVAFRTQGHDKALPNGDRALLDNLSFTRAAIDARPESYVIKTWDGGDVANSNAIRFDFHRPLTASERKQLTQRMEAHGFPAVDDTGSGVVAANFGGGPVDIERLKAVQAAVQEILPGTNPIRTRAEMIHNDLRPLFAQSEGSGAVTDELLRRANSTPAMREAVDQNVYLRKAALDRAERDEAGAERFGAPREDIQNLRRLIGEGPGGIARLEEARRTGSVPLPSHVPLPFGPKVHTEPPVKGEAAPPSYLPVRVDDLPKMTEARWAELSRELIAQSVYENVERRRREWLQRNAPPPIRIPRYDPIY